MPLVDTRHMFKKAYEGQYAIGAFNVNNMEIIQGIVDACAKLKSPVILQVSKGAMNYARIPYIVHLVKAALEEHEELEIALHLDHGATFEICKECIDNGFTSVMIDGSSLPYEENVALTKRVCDYAHSLDRYVTVEGELGTLEGIEDEVVVKEGESSYTDPNMVVDFVSRTGVDSLAIAIGTSHGAFKYKKGTNPSLRFDILEEIEKKLPDFPIVLHGASSVIQEYVEMINEYGGNIVDAIGVSEDLLRKAAKSSVCKINIDSDLRLAFTGVLRRELATNKTNFDPRDYLKVARANIQEIVEHKILNVLGSDNKL